MLRFRAACQETCTVVIRRGYWAYWKLQAENSGPVIPLGPTPGFPLIAADLPAGEANYRLSLDQPPIVRVGLAISLAAALGLIGFTAFRRRWK